MDDAHASRYVWLVGGLSLVLLSGANVGSEASDINGRCTCPPDPGQYDANVRDVVFKGTAIGRRAGDDSDETTFLVEDVWTEIDADTVTVFSRVSGLCGARYWVGEQFLVFANYEREKVVTGVCDSHIVARAAQQHLDALGAPARSLTEAGLRRLRQQAIGIGEEIPNLATDRATIGVLVLGEQGVVWGRPVRIGDIVGRTDLQGRALFPDLPVGLYSAQVDLETGRHEFLILLRCPSVGRSVGNCGQTQVTVRVDAANPTHVSDLQRFGPTFTPWTEPPRLLERNELISKLIRNAGGLEVSVEEDPGGHPPGSVLELVIWVLVEASGEVLDVRIGRSSGDESVDRAVVSAVLESRFRPAMLRERAVSVWTRLFLWVTDEPTTSALLDEGFLGAGGPEQAGRC